MLHILLLILKIIGIILLIILGLILLILLVVLFVPLRYRLKGSGSGELKSLEGQMKFSWFLHLISGSATYENQKLNWKIRIAWKWIGETEKEETEKEETESSDTNQEEITAALAEREKIVSAQEIIQEADTTIESVSLDKDSLLQCENVKKEKKFERNTSKSENPVKNKKESIFTKIQTFFNKIKYTFQKICANMKLLIGTKEKLEDFITNEVHKTAFLRGMKELKRLLSFLKPKRFHLKAHIGFKDPSITGKLLACLSILYPYVGKNHLCVNPEFEEEIFEGNLTMRGCIRVVYLVVVAWNLFWDKTIRVTYKHIKNFK